MARHKQSDKIDAVIVPAERLHFTNAAGYAIVTCSAYVGLENQNTVH